MKNQFKGTPGPWIIGETYDKIADTNGNLVAITSFASNKEAEEANARLIAAAPEMLGALRRFMLSIECYPGVLDDTTLGDDYDYATQVINKALGE